MPTLPHWDAFPNQEAIVIYKSCQLMCLKLWTTMLIRHTYICFQRNSMGPKNTDYHVLLKPPHCRISFILCYRVHLIFDNTSSTSKNCYFMLLAKELVQQSLITFEYRLL